MNKWVLRGTSAAAAAAALTLGLALPASAAWVPGPGSANFYGLVSCGSTRTLNTHATFGSGTNFMEILKGDGSEATQSYPGSGTHYLVSYAYHTGYYQFEYVNSISKYGYTCDT